MADKTSSETVATWTLALVALGLLAGIAYRATQRGPATDRTIERILRDESLPGAVVAIGPAAGPYEVRAFGLADVRSNRAMVAGDRFKIASLTKPVTAEVVLGLVAEGDLLLTDRVADHVPAFETAGFGDVTIAQLMSHRSGLTRRGADDPYFMSESALKRTFDLESGALPDCVPLAEATLATGAGFEAGAAYEYSNAGYCWLGEVIEAVSGTPALVMVGTEADGLSFDAGSLTVAHFGAGPAGQPVNRPEIIGPAGGLMASAQDYAAFAGGVEIDGKALEPLASDDAVHSYGLGWRVWQDESAPYLTHFGSLPGAFSVVVRSEDQVGVVLFNGRPQGNDGPFTALRRALLADFKRIETE